VATGQSEKLLARHFRQVVMMLDGDEAGQRAAGNIAGRLAHTVWVRVVEVPQGRQPDQLSVGEIGDLLQGL